MGVIIKCKHCLSVLESKHRHDMKWCKCGTIAIDGGNDYTKITFNKQSDYEIVNEDDVAEIVGCYD